MKDQIERQDALDAIYKCTDIYINNLPTMIDKSETYKAISELPSAQPEIIRCKDCRWWDKFPKGEWLRMSDLSEKDDDRYKCSHCGNVVRHKSRIYLYTFNSWCGRCGSDNSRHTTIIEADKLKEDAPTVIEAEGE